MKDYERRIIWKRVSLSGLFRWKTTITKINIVTTLNGSLMLGFLFWLPTKHGAKWYFLLSKTYEGMEGNSKHTVEVIYCWNDLWCNCNTTHRKEKAVFFIKVNMERVPTIPIMGLIIKVLKIKSETPCADSCAERKACSTDLLNYLGAVKSKGHKDSTTTTGMSQ